MIKIYRVLISNSDSYWITDTDTGISAPLPICITGQDVDTIITGIMIDLSDWILRDLIETVFRHSEITMRYSILERCADRMQLIADRKINRDGGDDKYE